MRILAVGAMYPPPHMGGYELVWRATMRRAVTRGHDVRVLVSEHRRDLERPDDEPAVDRSLECYWDWSVQDWRPLGPLGRLRLERRNRSVFERHLAEFRPDVISWWSMGGMSLSLIMRARRAGVPSLLLPHDDWLVYGTRRDAWMRLWGGWRRALGPAAALLTRIPTRFDPRAAATVLANSEHILRRAVEAGVPLPPAAVVTPGIDDRFMDPAPEQPWGWRLLHVGRLDRQKGVDLAISALAELPAEATLVLAGTGDHEYEAELRSMAEALGLDGRVSFLGHVDSDALPSLYAESDVVLFPVRWEEPWGLVPLEAMGRGRPVVAAATGGATEYLRDEGNALTFPVDDVAALVGAVRRLGEDRALRERLRNQGIATAESHTATRFEERVVAEIERVGGGS